AGGNRHGNILGDAIVPWAGDTVLDAIAGEGELAAIAPMVVLVDDAADRRRIGGIAYPVQHHLRHCRLSLDWFAACLEIDGLGKALLFLLADSVCGQRRACP